MLNIQQFRYGADNFAYLIHGNRQAIAVDGGAWKEILSFLKQNGLSLELVTNTHAHYDHTSGNEHLIKATGAAFLKSSMFADNHTMMIDGEAILVYRTPGHTNDSVCFHTGHSLISGDTLFNATIGNCFSGNLHHFYSSIKRLMNLPDETIIYAGHDYLPFQILWPLPAISSRIMMILNLCGKYAAPEKFCTRRWLKNDG